MISKSKLDKSFTDTQWIRQGKGKIRINMKLVLSNLSSNALSVKDYGNTNLIVANLLQFQKKLVCFSIYMAPSARNIEKILKK